MKRFFSIFIVLVLLCACSNNFARPRETTVTTVSGAADTALPKQVMFAVSNQSQKYIDDAAENFCKKTNSIFKEGFTLTFAKSSNPLADLKSGKASIILLNGDAATELSPLFSACNELFRYQSYENFSMLLNSREVLEQLSASSKVKVYGAYYSGSSALASRVPLDKLLASKRSKDGTVTAYNVDAFTRPDSRTKQAFESIGIKAEDVDSTTTRATKLVAANSVAEFTYSELSQNIFENIQTMKHQDLTSTDTSEQSKLDEEILPLDELSDETIIVTRTFHDITPMWLIISPKLFESLSPTAYAALDEAAAFMTADIDDAVLAFEKEQLDTLEQQGVSVQNGFSTSRVRFRQPQNSSASSYSQQELNFRNLLGKI